jgi:phospholipid-binding lipoprotein MlaA
MITRRFVEVLFVVLMVPFSAHAGMPAMSGGAVPAVGAGKATPAPAVSVTAGGAEHIAPQPAVTAGEDVSIQEAGLVRLSQAGEGGIPATPAGDALTGSSSHGETAENDYQEEAEGPKIADPLEPWNRMMFTFNDKLYFWVLKPTAQGYNYVAPQPVRVAVRNLFSNAAAPVRFVNSLLQLKLYAAGTELARFALNTTFGLAGLFDVAEDQFNLYGQNEDLGQTLGSYGVGPGVYIVWPVFGPSSLRDTVGLAGDSFLNPLNYISPAEALLGVRTYETVNKTSLSIGEYEDMKAATVEPYTSVKDAFAQHRSYLIKE